MPKITKGTPFLLAVLLVLMMSSGGCRRGDGKYDYDDSLVNQAKIAALVKNARGIELRAFGDDGSLQFIQNAVAWLSSEKEVIVPVQLFYAPPFENQNLVFSLSNVSIKLVLLKDPGQGDILEEELGEIINLDKVKNKEADYVVIGRVGSIIRAPEGSYVLGEYDELSSGHVIFTVSQKGGSAFIRQTKIIETHKDGRGRGLINAEEQLSLSDLGELHFAIRDGRPELVGLLYIVEFIPEQPGKANAYSLDIRQIMK